MAAHTGPGLTGNTQTLTATAAVIVAAASYWRKVRIYNLDTAAVYVGGSTGLTTANGYPISPASVTEPNYFEIDLPPIATIWGIGDASAEIRFLVQDGFSSL